MIKAGDRADLRSVCAEVVELMAPVAVGQGKNIAVVGAADPVWVAGSGSALYRAIRNLVENAITHTAPGTTVEVAVGTDGTVVVSDEGAGIPVDQRELIFQRFWRGERRHSGSTGLRVRHRLTHRQGAWRQGRRARRTLARRGVRDQPATGGSGPWCVAPRRAVQKNAVVRSVNITAGPEVGASAGLM